MTSRRPAGLRRKAQKGAVAVAFIILAIALIGFVGLAMDIGRLYVSKAELQNAADACALAAAGALTGVNASQLTAAEDYGIAAGTRNLVGMQAVPATITANADVTFSDVLNGTYLTATAAAGNALSMRYVRCALTEANIPTILLKVANLIPGEAIGLSTVEAMATASLESSVLNCALPVAICQPDILNQPAGTWIHGVLQTSGNIQGAFKWINYDNSQQNTDLSNMITGTGRCNLNGTSTVYSRPGQVTSMFDAWNTRLGIYKSGGPNIADARPDSTGWVYDPIRFPAQFDAMPDYLARQDTTPKHQSSADYNLPTPSHRWATDAQYGTDSTQGGYAIDGRRLAIGPVIDCQALGNNGSTQILDWACYLILNPVFGPGETMYFEYRGSASNAPSPCVTSGAPGGPSAGGPKVPTLVQ